MRRTRRARMGHNRNIIVAKLVSITKNYPKNIIDLNAGRRNVVFGRVLNAWLDNSQESVIDRYVDEEAKDATSYALNIVTKELQ